MNRACMSAGRAAISAATVSSRISTCQDFNLPRHARLYLNFEITERGEKVGAAGPSGDQDEIARVIMQLAGSDPLTPIPLWRDECEAIARSKAAAARGEFATDEQIRSARRIGVSVRFPKARFP
jgi:hypothetical protein